MTMIPPDIHSDRAGSSDGSTETGETANLHPRKIFLDPRVLDGPDSNAILSDFVAAILGEADDDPGRLDAPFDK